MNLKSKYLGLDLENPVIIASSPFTASLDKIEDMERAGAGAIALKSVFEEQIEGESEYLARFQDYPEAADYIREYVGDNYIQGHLRLIEQAKKNIRIPVIASINCMSNGKWIEYAKKIEAAGADALELNIYLLPTHQNQKAEEIEKNYLEIISSVTQAVNIPVAVKLAPRFTNVLNIAQQIYNRRAKGIVMFNRFMEPDIDVDKIEVVASDRLSSRSELRPNLRFVAMCTPLVSDLDIAVSTGVHTGEDMVKAILAGAKAVEICTALYKSGENVINEMKTYLSNWMENHGFDSIEQCCGLLSNRKSEDYNELYMRAQYVRSFPK